MRGRKGTLIAAVVVVLLAAALLTGYFLLRPGTQAGEKGLTIQVVHGDGSGRAFSLETGEEYLGPALTEAGLVRGSQGEYGLFLETVDGETADQTAQQWWCVTKGGEQVMTGVDTTPIADGEQYELTLMVGW